MIMTKQFKSREARFRRMALQKGLIVHKDRPNKKEGINGHGYSLEAANGTGYILGVVLNSIGDLERYLTA